MSNIRPKEVRLRLDPDSYSKLRNVVLLRDGWRCQACGGMANLEVHHQQFRSRHGSDIADNLITLCTICHRSLHG